MDRDGGFLGLLGADGAVEKSRRTGVDRDRGGELSYLGERKDAHGLDSFSVDEKKSLFRDETRITAPR